MSRLISYVLANRQSARKRVVIAIRFERDADIDLISVQDRDEQCVAIPCAAKAILILGSARALPTRPPPMVSASRRRGDCLAAAVVVRITNRLIIWPSVDPHLAMCWMGTRHTRRLYAG